MMIVKISKLIWICLAAAIHETWKRLRHGRVSPERGLGLEICVTATRNMLLEIDKWPVDRMQAVSSLGIPRKLLRQVEISKISLGGVRTQRTIARGADGSGPTILYIHGGGMVMCSPRSHRGIISHIAVETGACVYAPDYRLAPQNPFPAGIEDAFTVYRALLDQGIQPNRLIVGGDSAGATFTLALLMKLREAGLPYPAAAVTMSPGPDSTFPGDSWTRNAATDCLPLPVVRRWIGYYAKPDQVKDPMISPNYGDFTGFPPVLLQAGTAECFYDDIVLLADKMKAAGVDVTFESYAGMPHVWHLYSAIVPQGGAALRSIVRYIIEHTGQTVRTEAVKI